MVLWIYTVTLRLGLLCVPKCLNAELSMITACTVWVLLWIGILLSIDDYESDTAIGKMIEYNICNSIFINARQKWDI